MDDIFNQIAFWHWWAFAAVLLIIEMLAPSTFFLWMSIAAVFTGLSMLAFEMGWEIQFLIFSTLSVLSIILSRMYLKKHPIETDEPKLSRRGEQHIGKTYTLDTAIENGSGKVRVGDSYWRVEGNDMPAGIKVRVTAIKGSSFIVEAIE
ncbi:MAG: NfeD family protein [Gammaproteobacteria bacterium]|nr:MAG: NfeD family protein [Gammaproteobacteria bacterium]